MSSSETHLQLDLGLGNILLASAAVGNLLGLGDLGSDGFGAEVLKRVALDGIDAQDRVGLDDGEASRHCTASQVLVAALTWRGKDQDIRKNCLLLPLSSTTSIRPGFSCSMDGTWLARTPISPDSAGMLTCTTPCDL